MGAGIMHSWKYRPGDTVFVRAIVVECHPDYFQVCIQDDSTMSITSWVPIGELARREDIDQLKPPGRYRSTRR